MYQSTCCARNCVLETECWLGQALRPSFQIPASFSTIFIFGCWTRLTTHPIGTIYLKLGDLGEAEAAYRAVKVHTIDSGKSSISRPDNSL